MLRDLIRIASVNPPGRPELAAGHDTSGGETAVARYCAEVLTAAGIEATVIETAPGRGSCFGRLPATAPDPLPPLVLLSHVDVVPVEAEHWSRDPFGGELVDGEIWGRGAVDMKDMVAMELAVMLALRRERAELRRDVIFAALADEEAGGAFGALHFVAARPDLFASEAGTAAAALNEVGGYTMTIRGRRYYAIQVAEKGIAWTRFRAAGTPGHGSMPAADNAAVRIAAAVARMAGAPRPVRIVPVVAEFLRRTGLEEAATDAGALDRLVDDPVTRRSIDAMLRDTVSPNVLRAGTKMNVLPSFGEAEVDVRTLPGTDQQRLIEELSAAAGPGIAVEAVTVMPPVESPADAPIVELMQRALVAADPDGTPVPMMITPGTDAKALVRLGIPTYGFAPLRLDADVPFLSLFHGHDERVPASAVAFGLPVLYEVVSGYATATA
ncbi:MAG: M20/M25/M40 family metallo-hydrolase [Chloroflexota bacterium]|nr:M20/M25/M40 family metallo-hydrolase [Chloroflexota bacterium]